jgi:hypothetical protein
MAENNLNGSGTTTESDQPLGDEFFRKETSPQQPTEEIDLANYRAGQSLDLTKIVALPTSQKGEIRRPRPKEWFQACSTKTLERLWVHEGDGINDFYLVRNDIATAMPDEFVEVYLALCINSSGKMFLWPIKCGGQSGQEFTESALQHLSQAQTTWLRRKWVPRIKAHHADTNSLDGIEPEWPADLSVRTIISRAFAGKVIESLDHPRLRFVVRG